MTNKIRDLVTGARALEARLTMAFERIAPSPNGPGPTALEIVRAAADEVALHVQPSGRGGHVLPFNRITITFAAPTGEQEARFHALCAGPPAIHERVMKRLEAAGCVAADVDVSVAFAAAADPSWTRPDFSLALARVEPADRPPLVRLELTVTRGAADRDAYAFTALPVAIGRGAEVRDDRQQLLRVNHVAFTEGADEITQTVSRRHARIELDDLTRRLRLIDDNSAQGTTIVRGGRGIPVPRGSRGLAIQAGDEIVLGKARLGVKCVKSACLEHTMKS